MINTGVSDIFITNDLGFDLDRVSKVAKDNKDIQIRCYLNLSQAYSKNNTGFTDFFIRPEDMNEYSQYINIGEFWMGEEQQNILY